MENSAPEQSAKPDTTSAQPVTPSTPSQAPQQSVGNPPHVHSRRKLLFAGLVGAFLLVGVGIGAYILGSKNASKTPVVYQPSPTTAQSPVDITANWKEHTIDIVGLRFKLPPEIESMGSWKEEIHDGQTGTTLCFQIPEKSTGLIPKAFAGGVGVCNSANTADFVIGGTSKDFSAGREGVLTDLQGFTEKGGKYYARFVDNNQIEIPLKVEKVANKNGVEIIMFKGQKKEPDMTLWPNENEIVALINTTDKTYPGLTVTASLKTLDEDVFDQILSTMKIGISSNSQASSQMKKYVIKGLNVQVTYPEDWTVKEDGQLTLEGKEGKVIAVWGSGLGGGCDAKDHHQLIFFNSSRDICHGTQEAGNLYWSQLYQEVDGDKQISVRAEAPNSPQNKAVIEQILSSFTFVH